ncbi:MAG: hypothetical protein Q8S84_04285 [bacterium]|nr:hypothetical protein [bacterium]MDP3380723.1 hypothetical protein [bacterium]
MLACKYSLINVEISGAGFLNNEEPKLTIVQTSIWLLEFCFTYVLLDIKSLIFQYREPVTFNIFVVVHPIHSILPHFESFSILIYVQSINVTFVFTCIFHHFTTNAILSTTSILALIIKFQFSTIYVLDHLILLNVLVSTLKFLFFNINTFSIQL